MTLDKERYIPIIAIFLLLISSITSLYVYAIETKGTVNSNNIIIDDEELTFEYLFSNIKIKNFEQINLTGIPLNGIINFIDIDCPSCHDYRLIGRDGYSQTVLWKNMQNGLLTEEKRVVFIDLPDAFNIKDIVEIEVL